jgi:hypothetical protein
MARRLRRAGTEGDIMFMAGLGFKDGGTLRRRFGITDIYWDAISRSMPPPIKPILA